MNTTDNSMSIPSQNIDINTIPWLSCKCGSVFFESTVMVKKVSQLISPTGREEIVPVDMIICRSCGKVPGFFASRVPSLPEEMIAKNE
jgi:hypothetical protein